MKINKITTELSTVHKSLISVKIEVSILFLTYYQYFTNHLLFTKNKS